MPQHRAVSPLEVRGNYKRRVDAPALLPCRTAADVGEFPELDPIFQQQRYSYAGVPGVHVYVGWRRELRSHSLSLPVFQDEEAGIDPAGHEQTTIWKEHYA